MTMLRKPVVGALCFTRHFFAFAAIGLVAFYGPVLSVVAGEETMPPFVEAVFDYANDINFPLESGSYGNLEYVQIGDSSSADLYYAAEGKQQSGLASSLGSIKVHSTNSSYL